MTRIDLNPVSLSLDTETITPAHARHPAEASGKDAFAEIFAGLAMQSTVGVPKPPPAAPMPDPGASTGVALQTVDLSPSMRLIMPATPIPDSASLHAFARLQGLDESAIQQLFGTTADPATTMRAIAPTGNSLPAGLEAGSTPPGAQPPTAVDPRLAGATLSAPLAMGLGLNMTAMSSGTPATDPSIPPAGNVLSVGIQRLLSSAVGAAAEAGQTMQQPPTMGEDIEVISLDLSPTDEAAMDLPLEPEIAPGAEGSGKLGSVMPPTTLGTWDELGASASVASLSKGLRGQTLLAADMAPTFTNSADDLLTPTASTTSSSASSAGAHTQTGSAWNGAGASQGAPTAIADTLNTGDVAASRQLSEQLVQRMGEQIAQRLMNKLAQGEWQFKFVLNPKNLGEIQVNLRMHGGSLDGTFLASQAATRDMLGDGLQRLKDVLNNAGMNVANFDVGADHSSRQGRQPMTAGQLAPTLALQGLQQAQPATSSVQTTGTRGGDSGWDVLV